MTELLLASVLADATVWGPRERDLILDASDGHLARLDALHGEMEALDDDPDDAHELAILRLERLHAQGDGRVLDGLADLAISTAGVARS